MGCAPVPLVRSRRCAGIYTGSIYNDKALRDTGLFGERFHGPEVVAVKSHIGHAPSLENGRLLRFYNKVIFLHRNPFEAMVAERKRVVSAAISFWNSHVMTPPLQDFMCGHVYKGSDPTKYPRTSALSWDEWVRTVGVPRWINTTRMAWGIRDNRTLPVHEVRYDELKKSVVPVMRGVLDFIGVPPARPPPLREPVPTAVLWAQTKTPSVQCAC